MCLGTWKQVAWNQCISSRNTHHAQFEYTGPSTFIYAMKMVHRSGRIGCQPRSYTRWGCHTGDHGDINIVVTGKSIKINFYLRNASCNITEMKCTDNFKNFQHQSASLLAKKRNWKRLSFLKMHQSNSRYVNGMQMCVKKIRHTSRSRFATATSGLHLQEAFTG